MVRRLCEDMHDACDDLIAAATEVVEPHDPAEVEAFAAKLCGLEGLTPQEVTNRLVGIAIPRDFRHFRITNLSTGLPSVARVAAFLQPLVIGDVLCAMYCVLQRDDVTPHGKGVWTETVALPVIHRGMLELGVRFHPLQ